MGKKVRLTTPAGSCSVVSAQDENESGNVLQVPKHCPSFIPAVSILTCEAMVTNLHSTEKKTSSQRGGSDHGKGNRDLIWELDLLLLWGLLLVFQIRRPSRDQNRFSRVGYFPMNELYFMENPVKSFPLVSSGFPQALQRVGAE